MSSKLSSSTEASEIYLALAASLAELSQLTQKAYRCTLIEWTEFLGETWGTDQAIDAILQASRNDAARYKEYALAKIGIKDRDTGRRTAAAPATVRRKVGSLKTIYSKLVAMELSTANPFLAVRLPALSSQKRPINALPFDQVPKLVDSPGRDGDRALRNRAILAVLYGGGLRESEVRRLKIADFKLSEKGTQYLVLDNTKNGTRAELALPDWSAVEVAHWRDRRLEVGAPVEEPLFCSFNPRNAEHRSRKMAAGSIYRIHREAVARSGLPVNQFSTHSGRVTSISKLLSDGVSHREVKVFSRHKSIDMVDRYDRVYVSLNEQPGTRLSYKVAER